MGDKITWGPWQLCVVGAPVPDGPYQSIVQPGGGGVMLFGEEARTYEVYWGPLAIAFRVPAQDEMYGVHMNHCNMGEYEGTCKYGDDDCPVLAPKPGETLTIEGASGAFEFKAPKPPKWTPHDGGECPVSGETLVKVKFRDCPTSDWVDASALYWGPFNGNGTITHYRVKRKQPGVK